LVEQYGVTLASIESPSYGSSGHIVQLSEMSFASRMVLREAGIPYYMVSPKTMKKYIAGHGSAEKEDIQRSILEKYFLVFSDDNEADAFGLARMLLELGEEMEFYIKSGGGDLYAKQLKTKMKDKIHELI
jgi:Holliday junction resolvasome RuvABC endonuclease subunit